MGNPAGVRRDFEALEKRRFQAIKLLEQGLHQAEVGRQVGVARQSVSRWAKVLEAKGKASLRQAGRAGRLPRLSEKQVAHLKRKLLQGAEACGYPSGLWTIGRVTHLIEKETGQEYHPGHVWRLLRQMGGSSQRPTGRALERNEAEIAAWKKKQWPRIKKKPGGKGER